MKTFRRELMELINRHSKENGSNTPDFILAEYLVESLKLYDKIVNMRNEWHGEKLMRKVVDENKDEQQRLFDNVDFNNLCAKATLYPGKSITEVEDLQFMEKVKESYKFINSVLIGTQPMNNEETRQWVTKTLSGRLKNNVVVKCNNSNNPSDVIDNCLLVARIMRNNPDNSPGFRFMDLIFGEELKVKEYHMQHYFDNAIFAYIGKGI